MNILPRVVQNLIVYLYVIVYPYSSQTPLCPSPAPFLFGNHKSVLWNHRSFYCLHSFVFSRISCSWNHAMCSLVRLASATHQFALMFPPRRALAGWLMCFHLPGRLHCLAMSRLLDPLPSCFQWYLHFSPPSASHSWELMGGDWSLHPTVALASETRPAR